LPSSSPLPRRCSLSVVIPVYNSESTLPQLVERLAVVLAEAATSYELVLVNDCSTDSSWPGIEDLTRRYDWIRAFDLSRNFGQHNALLCGIREARNEVIITMDDDLQIPPEEIPVLLSALTDDQDVVYGVRDREGHSLLRNFAARLTKLVLQKSMGAEVASKITSFRAFRRDLREGFCDYSGPFVSIDVLLTWTTTRFTSVVTRHEPRRQGESGYTLGKLITHALNMVTGFSVLPLQIASLIGFVFTLFGVGIIAFVLIQFAIGGRDVPGFTFLASSIAIFSGAQLLALGIIGEYLARIHFSSMDRPPFVVRQTIDSGSSPENHAGV